MTVAAIPNTTQRIVAHLAICDLRRARAEIVARELSMSDSTMRRHLASEGSSFQTLLDDERKRRVQSMHGCHGKRLADACGYTELNSFYRAFRRWYGRNFIEYRLSCGVVE